jgi:type II secretory pathway component PulC
MLKKIGQFLADIKNKIRPGKKISEESSDNATDQSSSPNDSVSPFDQLVQNLREQQENENAQKPDKTGEVKIPQELQGAPVAVENKEISLENSTNPKAIELNEPAAIAPIELVKEESLPQKENTNSKIEVLQKNEIPPLADEPASEGDKTPVPQFDSIPTGKIPKFDSLPQNNSVFENEGDGNTGSHQVNLDSSQPLYKIPKKSRLPQLSKIFNIFSPLFKNILGKMKKDRPDLFEGTDSGAKLNLIKIYEIIFSAESRPIIHQGFIILLVVFISYATGKTIALILKGKNSIPIAKARTIDLGALNEPKDLNIIGIANLFNAHDLSDIKKTRSEINQPCTIADAQTSSSLPIKVINTVVLQDSVKSLAAVQLRSRPTLMEFREGEKIENFATLDKIDRLKIVIRNLESNQCEFLSNNTDSSRNVLQVMSPTEAKAFVQTKQHPDITNEGNTFQIKKRYLNEKLKDIGLVLTQAKAVKITNPDGSLSFKMTEVDPGGPFASLNVHVDDTIIGVNGRKFTSMNEVMDLFGKVKDMDKLSITVMREGEEQVMEYNFTN